MPAGSAIRPKDGVDRTVHLATQPRSKLGPALAVIIRSLVGTNDSGDQPARGFYRIIIENDSLVIMLARHIGVGNVVRNRLTRLAARRRAAQFSKCNETRPDFYGRMRHSVSSTVAMMTTQAIIMRRRRVVSNATTTVPHSNTRRGKF